MTILQNDVNESSWHAYLEIDLCPVANKTRAIPKKRFGPLSVQRPFYPEGNLCHLYLLHPPGGVVGGDQLELVISSHENSHSLITTPGANKFYRSAGGKAKFRQQLTISESASLEFLPMESIYFPGAIVDATTEVSVADNSQFIYWESHCFGRPSISEPFDSGEVTLSVAISNPHGLILNEKQTINSLEINRSCSMRGFCVVSTLFVYGYKLNHDEMESLRAIQVEDGYIALTQFDEQLLIVRYLGNSTENSQRAFRNMWTLLRPLVIQRNICPPRIWNT